MLNSKAHSNPLNLGEAGFLSHLLLGVSTAGSGMLAPMSDARLLRSIKTTEELVLNARSPLSFQDSDSVVLAWCSGLWIFNKLLQASLTTVVQGSDQKAVSDDLALLLASEGRLLFLASPLFTNG